MSKNNEIDLSSIQVNVESAVGVGGVYPFIVACFDSDIASEIYKTNAVNGGMEEILFDEQFQIDLQLEEKSRKADGKQLPRYLTFYLYDTGTQGIPSLGSAGVLLDTVREQGIAKGDFPIVNGTGVLKLSVQSQPQNKSWIHSDSAKVTAGVLGVGALAAGVAAMAVGGKKKKNIKKNPTEVDQQKSKDLQQHDGDDGDNDELDDDDHDDHEIDGDDDLDHHGNTQHNIGSSSHA